MKHRLEAVVKRLREAYRRREGEPIVTALAKKRKNPYRILVATIISARTRDETTAEAAARLFERAPDAESLSRLDEDEIASLIYPAGFYRTKAAHLRRLGEVLVDKYDGEVPSSMEELLKLPGVGRKTANLVLGLAFGIDAVCVDTHVHRISNRLGFVKTSSPEETERVLRDILPRRYWIEYNTLLVSHGQHVCKPISPRCDACVVRDLCDTGRGGDTR